MLTMKIDSDEYPFSYVVLKVQHGKIDVLGEAEGTRIFKEKFYNVKMEYSQSAME